MDRFLCSETEVKLRKGISKQKRYLIEKRVKGKVAGSLLLLGMLAGVAGSGVPVYGQEAAGKVVVTDIYHIHRGNPSAKGGCYQEEIPHVHQGNEAQGGACYQTPVLHMHQGEETSGTGCYTHVVYHIHDGDEGRAGDCYSACYHTHEDSCYENKICTIRYTKGEVTGSSIQDCDEHGSYEHERAAGMAAHENCKAGDVEVQLEYCAGCGPMTYSYHTYKEAVCGTDTDQPVGYEKTCGKEENTIEGYETACGFEEGAVSGYQLSCEKKTEGYKRNCGLEDDEPCGRLVITNETIDRQETVTVSVRMEDLSGGKLILSDRPFVWYDETGKCIGDGKTIEVRQNGRYTAELRLQNKDVDEQGLKSSILVDNVLARTEVSPSPDSEKTPVPGSTPAASPKKERPDPQPTEAPSEKEPSGEENPSPLPTASPTPTRQVPEAQGEDHDLTGNAHRPSEKRQEGQDPGGEMTGSLDKKAPVALKEIQKKELPQKMAALSVPGEIKKIGFWQRVFAIPEVRIIAIAAGVLLLISGLLLLLLFVCNSVRLYNDDGEGRFFYLGRCPIRLEEDGYAMTISEKAVEKSYTNRYCIRPGFFRLGKGEQEILVYKDTKRTGVALDREMIFMI